MVDIAKAPDGYFIRSDYRANETAPTFDARSGETYWTEKRIRGSLVYQFDVYRYAERVARASGVRRVLDVGCGTGEKLAYLAGRHPAVDFVGVDQPNAIDYCNAHRRFGRWIADDLERPTGSTDGIRADLVIAADVIEHLINPDRLLEYVQSHLNPNGLVLLSTPERERLQGADCRHSPNPQHVREWNFQEFGRYLRSRGFSILDHHLQLPVRVGWSREFLDYLACRLRDQLPLCSNQVCLIRPA